MLAWVGLDFFSSAISWPGFEFRCFLPLAKHSFYSSSNKNYFFV